VLQTRVKIADSKNIQISPFISLEEMLVAQRVARSLECPLSAAPTYFSFSDAYLDLTPKSDALYQIRDASEFVMVGSLNRTLASLIRLEQLRGKKLTLVAFPEDEPFTRFGDLHLPDLQGVQATPESCLSTIKTGFRKHWLPKSGILQTLQTSCIPQIIRTTADFWR
jgi:hypothetical protein